MHIDGFVRGKGKFMITEYVPTDERTGPRFPLLLTTGPHPRRSTTSARRRGAPTTSLWHEEDVLEIHPHDAEQRGVKRRRLGAHRQPRRRDGAARADHRPRGAGRRLHDLPPPDDAGQRHHHRLLRLGDQLPRIQGDGGAGARRPTARRTGRRTTTRSPKRAGASRRPRRRSSRHDRRRRTVSPSLQGRRHRRRSRRERCVPEEMPVALVYDGTTHAVMMATPADLEDFALGFSLTEGIIATPEEIASLEVVEHADGIELRMWLAGGRRARPGRAPPAHRRADRLRAVRHREPRRGGAAAAASRRRRSDGLSAADIAAALAALAPAQALNRETRAVHGAGFWTTAARARRDCARTSAATTRSTS